MTGSASDAVLAFGAILGVVVGLVFGLTVVVLFIVLVHETGHAVAAKLIGFEVMSFCVGPLLWSKADGRWGFSWWGDWTLGGFVFANSKSDVDIKKKYVALFAGGPIASFLLAATVAAIYLSYPESRIWLRPLLIFTSSMLLTLVPAKAGGLGTDGYWLWNLLLRPKVAERLLCATRLQHLTQRDVPPTEWPASLVTPLRDLTEPMMQHVAARTAEICFAIATDDRDLAIAAGKDLETLLDEFDFDSLSRRLVPVIALDAAIVQALVVKDAGRARELLTRATPFPPEYEYLAHETMCAVFHLKGRPNDSVVAAEHTMRTMIEHYRNRPNSMRQIAENLRYVSEDARRAAHAFLDSELAHSN